MVIAIIDYGSGNLHSISKAVEKAAKGEKKVIVTSNSRDIKEAERIILPGVGAFGDCVKGLNDLNGVREALDYAVQVEKKPFLGVCVGMQMLAEKGYENGDYEGLGWIRGEVKKIEVGESNLKIPHMGWNELKIERNHPVFKDIKNGDHAYFVHSYCFECRDKENVLATVEYGENNIVAAIARDNIVATQFHPEKSQDVGLQLLMNFIGFDYV